VGTRETQKKKEKQGNIASLLFKKKKYLQGHYTKTKRENVKRKTDGNQKGNQSRRE